MSYLETNSNTWFYREMGSIDKKTGKHREYDVTVENYVITGCTCPARDFRRYSPCKHMKKIHEYCPHLKMG